MLQHDDSPLVAAYRLHSETFDVNRDNLEVYLGDINALFTHLMNLISGRVRFDSALQNDPMRRIGHPPARFGAKTLYFSVPKHDASLLAAATELSGKQAIFWMVPTLHVCNCDIKAIANRFQVIVKAADELFVATSSGIIIDAYRISSLRLGASLGSDAGFGICWTPLKAEISK